MKVLHFGLVLLALRVAIQFFVPPKFHAHASGAVLVTGASSGIGRHAAVELARRGFSVFGSVRKDADGEALKAECARCTPLRMDVAKEESIAAALEELRAALAAQSLPLVALVNNAGVSHRVPAELEDAGKLRRMFDVNFFGAHRLTQLLLPDLRRDKGRVINVGSVAGLIAAPSSSSYSATKFALEAWTDALRREVRAFGVAVSMINPAYVKTKIAQKQLGTGSALSGLSPEQLQLYAHVTKSQDEKRARAEAMADPPTVTTDAIVHAVTSERPRRRYVVANYFGLPAWVLHEVIKALPDELIDLVTAPKIDGTTSLLDSVTDRDL